MSDSDVLLMFSVYLVERDLNVGDHGYARRQPTLGMEEDADELHKAEERPCTHCQPYKTLLEQEMQHTARLQKEVCWLLPFPNYFKLLPHIS